MKFIAIGDVMVDVVCARLPHPGERIHGDVAVRAGGSAVNAALAASEAGATASIIGRVGRDAAGDFVLSGLAARGIHTALARDAEAPTGTAVAFSDQQATTVIASRGANARLHVADVPEEIESDALFVSGFALFQDGSDAAAELAIERFGGPWVGVDVGSPALAPRADELVHMDEHQTVLFATAEEAHALTGREPEQAARTLAERFAIACVKLGTDGALAVQGRRVEHARPAIVTASSALGAGDAFAGTFLARIAAGDSLGDVLQLACDAGARKGTSQ